MNVIAFLKTTQQIIIPSIKKFIYDVINCISVCCYIIFFLCSILIFGILGMTLLFELVLFIEGCNRYILCNNKIPYNKLNYFDQLNRYLVINHISSKLLYMVITTSITRCVLSSNHLKNKKNIIHKIFLIIFYALYAYYVNILQYFNIILSLYAIIIIIISLLPTINQYQEIYNENLAKLEQNELITKTKKDDLMIT